MDHNVQDFFHEEIFDYKKSKKFLHGCETSNPKFRFESLHETLRGHIGSFVAYLREEEQEVNSPYRPLAFFAICVMDVNKNMHQPQHITLTKLSAEPALNHSIWPSLKE
jgi:hypothetical protein